MRTWTPFRGHHSTHDTGNDLEAEENTDAEGGRTHRGVALGQLEGKDPELTFFPSFISKQLEK